MGISSYINGFCKVASANGISPYSLIKIAQNAVDQNPNSYFLKDDYVPQGINKNEVIPTATGSGSGVHGVYNDYSSQWNHDTNSNLTNYEKVLQERQSIQPVYKKNSWWKRMLTGVDGQLEDSEEMKARKLQIQADPTMKDYYGRRNAAADDVFKSMRGVDPKSLTIENQKDLAARWNKVYNGQDPDAPTDYMAMPSTVGAYNTNNVPILKYSPTGTPQLDYRNNNSFNAINEYKKSLQPQEIKNPWWKRVLTGVDTTYKPSQAATQQMINSRLDPTKKNFYNHYNKSIDKALATTGNGDPVARQRAYGVGTNEDNAFLKALTGTFNNAMYNYR